MNLNVLANALTMDEVNDLSNILYERKVAFYRINQNPLDTDEKILADQGYWIDAIKQYRYRNAASLLEAKIAVDAYAIRGLGKL